MLIATGDNEVVENASAALPECPGVKLTAVTGHSKASGSWLDLTRLSRRPPKAGPPDGRSGYKKHRYDAACLQLGYNRLPQNGVA
jgi:hypothetical protein